MNQVEKDIARDRQAGHDDLGADPIPIPFLIASGGSHKFATLDFVRIVRFVRKRPFLFFRKLPYTTQ
jgi:hypothetical protein